MNKLKEDYNTNDRVWYCVNNKGHRIPPYKSNYSEPKRYIYKELWFFILFLVCLFSLAVIVLMSL